MVLSFTLIFNFVHLLTLLLAGSEFMSRPVQQLGYVV